MKKAQLLILIFLAFIFTLKSKAQNTIEVDCKNIFLSGANIAWSHFARDIGYSEPNYAEFNNYFSEIKASGGNSVRWWLHTTAQNTPEIEYSGNVPGLSNTFTNEEIIDQIKSVLDIALSNEIYVNISLFSFNLLERDRQAGMNFVGNKRFLESPTNVQSYIDNALTPMVSALKNHPALLMWEIFNEAEGMSEEFGWTGSQGEVIPMSSIQMVVNKLAGAIHDADPNALVTNGSLSMLTNTNVELYFNYAEEYQKNYYSDAELIAAGGVANGTLDLYQVHYYGGMPNTASPLHNPASHWQLDKPIMLGEFYAHEVKSIATDNGYSEDGIFEYLYDNGYYGAWPWQWEDSPSIPDIKAQITHMQTAHPTIVDINMDNCPDNTLDDDNDGVTNDVDLCLDTPDGETVNSDGCSTNDLADSDNDGVINGTDACPNTPNGESVDANGCSTNELLDDDNDGIINGNDLCPSTPSNELVNNDGCSGSQLDSDQDGVTNKLDYCENTPIGETVNANGCTDNQIDDDQDGVINNLDFCRNSPSNYSVNSDGCAIVTIPDANFEQELITLNIDTDGLINQQIKYMDVRDVSTLDLSNKNISNLNGIEAFVSLTELVIGGNQISSLDITNNIALTYLYASSNQISSLDVSNNILLTRLYLGNNQISSVDVSNNILLTNLDLGANLLTHADVSNNSNLTIFTINHIPTLTSLNLKNGNNTAITIFFANSNPNLTCIQVDDATYSANNWTVIDSQSYFSEDCGDDDNDGVLNTSDLCSNTPTEETVDATGCSQSQIDDDEDGVMNDKDICPSTPIGETVGATGCSQSQIDDDEDGVMNDKDICPSTPTGETVDAAGCSQSQIDDDEDGVMNDKDACPSTPTGETVDATGCSESQFDDDEDGVINEIDVCPSTPTGETVDATGCSQSQIDNDEDGVMNDKDLYPNTPEGANVDANGGLIIDPSLFNISWKSSTCPNINNAEIRIQINQSYPLDVTVNGPSGYSKVTNNQVLTSPIVLTELASGQYQVSFSFTNNLGADYNGYILNISEAPKVTGKAIKTYKQSKTATFNVSGDKSYLIFTNGEYLKEVTFLDESVHEIVVDNLFLGENYVKIVPKNACRGIVEQWITIQGHIQFYPNPTQDLVTLKGLTSEEVNIQVFNTARSQLFNNKYKTHQGMVTFSLENSPSGIYIVKVIGNGNDTVEFKVIKK